MGLGSLVKGAVGAVGGSGLGILGATAGSLFDAGANLYSQHDARIASENLYRHRYRIMVNDLMEAGLNPMLAYMKDAGTPPSVGGGQISGGTAGAINQARINSAQIANIEADTANKGAQAKLWEAQAYEHMAGGQLKDTQSAQMHRLMESIVGKTAAEAEAAILALPRMRNLSEAEKGKFKREISPYLDDFNSMSNSAQALSNALKIGQIIDLFTRKDKRTDVYHHRPSRSNPYGVPTP